jgi:Putative DNA-binding domain
MSLATYQQTLKELLMMEAGETALSSASELESFLESTLLSAGDKTQFKAQDMENLKQYRYMVVATVEETLKAVFPYCFKLLKESWKRLAESYSLAHPSDTYRLLYTVEAFPEFLKEQKLPLSKYPFLPDLALYEWIEAALLGACNPVYPTNLLAEIPAARAGLETLAPTLNAVSDCLFLQYPIHEMLHFLKTHSAKEILAKNFTEKPTVLWMFRDTASHQCRTFTLNALLAFWLNLVKAAQDKNEMMSYQESFDKLLIEVGQSTIQVDTERFYQESLKIQKQLKETGVLLGSVRIDA